jgi:hypothetical protein
MPDQPWHELPPEVAEILRPALGSVADEMIDAVRTVPAYARPIEGPFGLGIRAGVEEALRHFVAEIEAQGRVARLDVYLGLGRGEMRAGRRLEALLAAYRIGARVAWRRFAALGAEAGLQPELLYLLAESIFAYIDELSAESAEGYALEQSAAAGEAELRRRRVARLLVRDPPADPLAVQAAAQEAGWALPRELAAVAIGGGSRDAAVARLPPDAICEIFGEVACALVPDPDGPGRRSAVEHAILAVGATAGLGPTLDPDAAALSFARALAAMELIAPEPGLVAASDRAGELLLRSDTGLARELADQKLAPLAELPDGSRARLTETLAAWLAEQGRLGPVAERLGVHPQTVRYRVGRLRDLMGDALDDPDERFWLAMALRVG